MEESLKLVYPNYKSYLKIKERKREIEQPNVVSDSKEMKEIMATLKEHMGYQVIELHQKIKKELKDGPQETDKLSFLSNSSDEDQPSSRDSEEVQEQIPKAQPLDTDIYQLLTRDIERIIKILP